MKVTNMTNSSGNKVANQFIITNGIRTYFQSYDTIIASVDIATGKVTLDAANWNYSTTTGKYRNQFLDESKAETETKIKSGEYILADLN